MAPERASWRAILWDLQACITEPARITHCCTRDIVRRLLFIRGKTSRERASATGIADKIVEDAAVKGTGTGAAEKESPAASDDDEERNQQQDDDDDNGSDTDYAAECGSIDEDDGYDSDIDYALYMRDDDSLDSLRSQIIGYYGDSVNIELAYSSSRYLVELLAVRPHFHFVGKLYASDSEDRSFYYCSSQRVEDYRNILDSRGNLILHAEDGPLEDNFYMEIKIPEDDQGSEYDAGWFSFTVDPYACNHVITKTISTAGRREIHLTFIPMHTAIRADVKVTLNLMSASTNYYVHGEITACHQFYDGERVTLFSRREGNKAEVIDGNLPLSRSWAAVPITLEPVLTVKLNLIVSTKHDQEDGEGRAISFRGEVSFYHDQFEKIVCSADHGEVKVHLQYW